MSQDAYRSMLKATSALASAKIVTIAVSIIRTKVLATLLGPSGIGIIGMLNSSMDLARVLFSCGIDGATVRRVAQSTDDPSQLERVYKISSLTALILGALAALVFAGLSPLLARHFLADSSKYWWFILAGTSLIITPVLGVQLSFLQGIKESKSLAICQIIASLAGAISNIILVWSLGLIGAISAILPVILISFLVHRHFVKKFRTISANFPITNFLSEFKTLIKFGAAFAINGIWLTASGWLNIFFLTKQYGPANAPLQIGLHGAASMLANFYMGILISSMGTEFYPRLIQAAKDKPKLNELLNQQTRLCMAIGVPISAGMILLAPWMLHILYSKDFSQASEIMRWILLGMTIRFISCPIGFALLAVGKPRIIAMSEILMGLTLIGSSWLMIQKFGLVGIGMALVIANSLYLAGVAITMLAQGVRWSGNTIRIVLETLIIMAVCLGLLLRGQSMGAFIISTILIAILSIRHAIILKKDTNLDLRNLLNKYILKKNLK